MIKRFIPFMLVAIAAFLNVGCSEDNDFVIWDISPVEFKIRLENKDGQNLLNPDVEGNLIGREMYVSYNDEIYPVDWNPIEREKTSRYFIPSFEGLRLRRIYEQIGNQVVETGSYQLVFGGFDGNIDQDLEIIFFIGDRSGFDTLNMVHRIEWKKNNPVTTNALTVNGELSDTPYARIVL